MVESIWWGQAALTATHERAGRDKVHGAGLGAARVQLAAGLGAALGLGVRWASSARWAAGGERRMGRAGEAGRKEERWPSGPLGSCAGPAHAD